MAVMRAVKQVQHDVAVAEAHRRPAHDVRCAQRRESSKQLKERKRERKRSIVIPVARPKLLIMVRVDF